MLDLAHRRLDQIERKLAQLEMNPAPTVPQYDLQPTPLFNNTYVGVQEDIKTIPQWWNTDDTNNGNVVFTSWGSADRTQLCKFNGTDWISWAGQGVQGFYTTTSGGCAPSSPYYHISNVPIGGVGNDYQFRLYPSNAYPSYYISSGDIIAVVVYSAKTLAGGGPDQLNSTPYIKVHYKVYDTDNTTVLHDFGDLQINISSYNPPLSAYPGFPIMPAGAFVSASWTVP